VEIYGNVLDASMAGGVFINGGGNISIKNNIVLNGRTSRAKNPFFAPFDAKHHCDHFAKTGSG
jgi:hypothetical protein